MLVDVIYTNMPDSKPVLMVVESTRPKQEETDNNTVSLK